MLQGIHNAMGEQLAEGSGSEGSGKWGDIRLVSRHEWGSILGPGLRSDPIYVIPGYGMGRKPACLWLTLSWEELLTV